MAAELVAHRRDGLHRRRVVLAGDEARVERGGDRRRRDGVLDAGLDGPAALAGVLGVAGDLVEARVLVERGDHEVEQPRPDDGALAPGAEDLGDVVGELGLLEQLPALGVGLHDRVLDAVVDHLGEVAGADLAGVDGAEVALGLEGVEGRLHLGDVGGVAAVHQRVAVLQAPDAAGDAAVDVADLLLGEQLGVGDVVGPARVAAVDDHVALAEQVGELLDRRRGSGRRRAPSPTRPWGSAAPRRAPASESTSLTSGLRSSPTTVSPARRMPLAHVAAHLAEPDESDVHVASLAVRSRRGVRGSWPVSASDVRQPSRRRGISR